MLSKWAAFVPLLGLAVLHACLPDLAALPAPQPDAAFPIANACGNGVIDTDAETCDPGPNDAGTQGCQDCNVVCEGVLDPVTKHCYFAVQSSTSLPDAKDACRARGAHVVTIGSFDERKNIEALDASPYWAGEFRGSPLNAYGSLNGLGLEPGWPEPEAGTGPCPGCFGFGLDGGSVAGDIEQCIVDGDGGWLGVPCAGRGYGTICEREPTGRRYQVCNGGLCFSTPETATIKSYLVILQRDTAANARTNCRSFGGQLVTLESAEERAALTRELLLMAPFDDSSSNEFWIGLHTDGAATWTWEGPRPGLAQPWGDKEPRPGTDAFLTITVGYDSSLARAGGAAGELLPYVCQLPL